MASIDRKDWSRSGLNGCGFWRTDKGSDLLCDNGSGIYQCLVDDRCWGLWNNHLGGARNKSFLYVTGGDSMQIGLMMSGGHMVVARSYLDKIPVEIHWVDGNEVIFAWGIPYQMLGLFKSHPISVDLIPEILIRINSFLSLILNNFEYISHHFCFVDTHWHVIFLVFKEIFVPDRRLQKMFFLRWMVLAEIFIEPNSCLSFIIIPNHIRCDFESSGLVVEMVISS